MIYVKDEESHEKLIRNIDAIIEKDYKNLKNVGEIASRLFISESYARKIYKNHTGKTIFEKLYVTKMEKAKELLVIQKLTTQNVATMVGYKSKSAFLEAFKRYTGHLPTDFSENLLKDEKEE